MMFSRAWFALMRRNFIYRRRNVIGTILELLLPMSFVGILVSIKRSAERGDGLTGGTIPAIFPSDQMAWTIFSFNDYVTAMQAERVCITKSSTGAGAAGAPFQFTQEPPDDSAEQFDFYISGINQNGYDWPVPFVKCNSYLCEYDGQDAMPFCEFGIMALAPSHTSDTGGAARANDFKDWLYAAYPILKTREGLHFDFDFVQHFENSQAIDRYVTSQDYGSKQNPKIIMAIVWEGNDTEKYYYTLRQNSTNFNAPESASRPAVLTTPDTSRRFKDYARNDFEVCQLTDSAPDVGRLQSSCTAQYMYNGVLTMQRLVGDYILNRTGASQKYKVDEGGVKFVSFPTRPYEESGFYESIKATGPLLVTLGMLYPVASMIAAIAGEKELRQKELMKMMSVTESDIGWSWFVSFLLFNILSVLLTTAVSTELYSNSDVSYLLLFWFTTFLALTVFAMFNATFTSTASRGVLVGLLVLFVGVFMAIAIPLDYSQDSGTFIALISLHPVAAFSYGLQEIGRLEDQGTGLQSGAIAHTDNPSGYTFYNAIRYLFFDCVFWGIITFYLNRVVTPDYGQALPLWFPFLPSFWFPSYNTSPDNDPAIFKEENVDDIPLEPVGKDLKRQADQGESIEIRGLRKVFGETIAVDRLNLSIYSGQITALLGHNGAGKTTTINMLTGAMAPTDGVALVAGKDIRTHMQVIRQDIGICLQHDCLFPLLTVREHVQLFSRLKGLYSKLPRKEAEEHVDQAIQDVALFEKRNTLSKNLSGGMKRKLSVAMAFCGGSKVVLLDEPTSGMDPFSRRFTWNVIRQYRQGRCIILTTHFMDEADILGDRIAIMAEGQLRCVGSSLFLKKTYGVGYQLTIEKSKTSVENQEPTKVTVLRNGPSVEELGRANSGADDLSLASSESLSTELRSNLTNPANMETVLINDTDRTFRIVTEAVPNASLLSNVGSEMTFQLPMSASSQFISMFEGLDHEMDNGRINSYGVSITTLEEVFLLVARGHAHEKSSLRAAQVEEELKHTATESTDKSIRSAMDLENDGLFIRHLGALFRKRAAYFRRDKKAWLCTAILPSLFVCLGFIVFTFAAPDRNQAPIILDLNDYNKEVVSFPRNPVPFNQPNSEFGCQPGNCVYHTPVVGSTQTNELYAFCGYIGTLDKDYNCAIGETSRIIRWIYDDDGAWPVPADVENIRQMSETLYDNMEKYEATQYGAITFTHDSWSFVIDGNNTLYRDKVQEACRARVGNYTTEATCDRYGGVGIVIQYNFTALHVAPLYQTLADEALVRSGTNNSNFEISVTIAPLPITSVEAGFGKAEDAFSAWFLVVLSFPFISGAFASFLVTERQSKAKHLQTVAGVDSSAYWLSTFLWDVLNYQIPLWITIMLMFAFNVDVLTTSERSVFSGIWAVLFLYGPASAAFTYCISQAFESASMCNMFVIISGFVIGMGGPLTCFILTLLGNQPGDPKPNLLRVVTILSWCLRFIPSFCLGNGIFHAININLYVFLEADVDLNAWSQPVLLYEVIFLAWETVVYLFLATQIDKWSTNPRALSIWQRCVSCVTFQWLLKRGQNKITAFSEALPDDDDVIAEQDRVLSGKANDDLIVISQLTKMYDNGKLAVDNLSLGIAPGECFGLLGINGAGKTTAMGMLTAEFPPTSGDATLAGFSVSREPEKIRRRIGYCPQFDAHFANLTGREHVELYASIKGVPRSSVKEAAAVKLREVGLSDLDIDRLSSGYSGGMKRRLSLACATIGQPQIVFLDECSTGVDPVARREIWQLVSDMVMGTNLPREERTSVILTTHSMEECEALCPRIGIMAAGRLRCLGSAQHLKNKFGKGYQVELKVMIIEREDDDFMSCRASIAPSKHPDVSDKHDSASSSEATEISLNLEETLAALKVLTGDDRLCGMIKEDNSAGYNIWRDASSHLGVALDDLAAFAASELRMLQLEAFMTENYPNHILRERQDSKARYEIASAGVRVSSIFSCIEANKETLRLADYGVSQTTLEQVFNMHAAEAERLKLGCNDG